MFALLRTLACAAALAASPALAQDAAPRSSAERDVVSSWLERDCQQGLRAADVTLLRAAPRASETLMSAYRSGPPEALVRRYEAAFAAAYEARGAALAEDGPAMFSEADIARLRQVSSASYIAQRLDQARLNYQTNAVLALGIVGGDGAKELLESIAADGRSPVRGAAARALGYLAGEIEPVAPDAARSD